MYIRKTERRLADAGAVKKAVELVEKGVSKAEAARREGVKRTTLLRLLKTGDLTERSFSHTVFSPTKEVLLADYIKKTSRLFHGLSATQTRKLAYEFAEATKTDIPSPWKRDRTAGIDWLTNFRKRHHISLRTPEATSIARARGFNKAAVEAFYQNLREVNEKYHGFKPENIWNIDETGITSVAAHPRILCETGTKQVGQISASERGELVTVVGAISASGASAPPFFVFPRKRWNDMLLLEAPNGSHGAAADKGWMTKEVFPDVLRHFITHMKPSEESPVLLLMDNHISHLSVEVIDLCHERNITVVTFPPHCSHRLQPLDVSVYGPLKNAYKIALNDWMVSNVSSRPSIYKLLGIFKIAFEKAITIQNITSGFKTTGIFPLHSLNFCDADFEPSTVHVPLVVNDNPSDQMPEHVVVTPESIQPLPQMSVEVRKKGREKGRSLILTSTPEKENIEKKSQKFLNSTVRDRVSQGEEPGTSGMTYRKNDASEDEANGIDENKSREELPVMQSGKERWSDVVSGDFIVVRVPSLHVRGEGRNYVAKVEAVTGSGFWAVFMESGKRSAVFHPGKESPKFVLTKDLIKILPHPEPVGGTNRARAFMKFPFSPL